MHSHYSTRWQWYRYTIEPEKMQLFFPAGVRKTDLKNIYDTGYTKNIRSRYNQKPEITYKKTGESTMKQRGTFSIQRLALVGMMAAMVFALTYVGIDIPTGLGKTKIHFGNIMCLLSAFLLGPVGGGLAAGVGSALFDLMRKASFLAPRVRVWTAALCGSLSYSILYLGKNVLESLYVKGFTWQVTQVEVLATKAPVTLFNGVVAVICAALLYTALTPALRKAHVLPA